jgi:hypothetical protein
MRLVKHVGIVLGVCMVLMDVYMPLLQIVISAGAKIQTYIVIVGLVTPVSPQPAVLVSRRQIIIVEEILLHLAIKLIVVAPVEPYLVTVIN